jgi:hypothetical protein
MSRFQPTLTLIFPRTTNIKPPNILVSWTWGALASAPVSIDLPTHHGWPPDLLRFISERFLKFTTIGCPAVRQ